MRARVIISLSKNFSFSFNSKHNTKKKTTNIVQKRSRYIYSRYNISSSNRIPSYFLPEYKVLGLSRYAMYMTFPHYSFFLFAFWRHLSHSIFPVYSRSARQWIFNFMGLLRDPHLRRLLNRRFFARQYFEHIGAYSRHSSPRGLMGVYI